MKKELPISSVLSIFFDMTGESDTESWLDFCRSSSDIILAGIRDDADIAANERAICYAAACHAFYIYVLRNCATGIASFKAVDISIDNINRLTIEAAKTVFEDSMAAIAHLLKTNNFAFKAV